MKGKNLHWTVRALFVLTLVSASSVLAQDRKQVHFSGLLNDYSTASVKGGPWEMHGQWSLDLRPERGTADFSAVMTISCRRPVSESVCWANAGCANVARRPDVEQQAAMRMFLL